MEGLQFLDDLPKKSLFAMGLYIWERRCADHLVPSVSPESAFSHLRWLKAINDIESHSTWTLILCSFPFFSHLELICESFSWHVEVPLRDFVRIIFWMISYPNTTFIHVRMSYDKYIVGNFKWSCCCTICVEGKGSRFPVYLIRIHFLFLKMTLHYLS